MTSLVAIRAKGKVEDVDAVLTHVNALSERHQMFLHVVDPDAAYSLRHLESAYAHAERAKAQGRMTGKTLGSEFLMYLTGERQVSTAIEKAGIRAGSESTIVVAAGPRAGTVIWGLLDKMGWAKDAAGVQPNANALARVGAKVTNGTTPEDAVLERVALVDLTK